MHAGRHLDNAAKRLVEAEASIDTPDINVNTKDGQKGPREKHATRSHEAPSPRVRCSGPENRRCH